MGREGWRGGMEGGNERGREGGRKRGREGGRERGSEGGRGREGASGTVGHHLGVTSSHVELRNYLVSRQSFRTSS